MRKAILLSCLTVFSLFGCVDPELDANKMDALAQGGESGLKAQYFNNMDFTSPGLERVDSSIDFDWGRSSPNSKIDSDTFSVRWTGFVLPKYSQTYTFYTIGDDGIRLYVDNKLVVNDWSNHGPRERSGTIALKAGQSYPIKLEYYESTGGAVAKLLWSSSSQAKQIIPATQLRTELADSGGDTGGDTTNIALGKPTSQSSTAFRGDSSRAVDGNTSGIYGNNSITHTNFEAAPWWRVELGRAFFVGSVVLFNRTESCCLDRLSNFNVDYLDQSGKVIATKLYSGVAPAKTTISLAAQGVYAVRVRLNGTNALSLAEVQVFSGTINEPEDPDDPVATNGPLDKASNTKLRIASWNNFRGSIFPKTSTVWKAINVSGNYHVTRTEGGARILDAVEADIWLMQETCYSSSGLPSGVSEDDVNKQIASYMQSVTGDSWTAKCNGRGLCAMVRGKIRFDGHWRKGTRVTGDRVILPDGTKVLLVNVHYMNTANAEDTKKLIEEVESTVSSVFVAGDFNNTPNDTRYKIIDGISGMNNLSMVHWKDPNAKHVKSSVQTAKHVNTKGYMKFGEGASGQDIVTSNGGGHIDHFFLKSNTWKAGNRFILNTLLFDRSTLNLYGIRPLDIAVRPDKYSTYFRDFLTKGIIYDVTAYDATNGLDHDHLPMIVDFTW